jgi:hypothetical protein
LGRAGAALTIQPLPTFSEIYLAASKALRAEIAAVDQPVA